MTPNNDTDLHSKAQVVVQEIKATAFSESVTDPEGVVRDIVERALVDAVQLAKDPHPRMAILPMSIGGERWAVCMDGKWDGWLFWQHPDGHWISNRKLDVGNSYPS